MIIECAAEGNYDNGNHNNLQWSVQQQAQFWSESAAFDSVFTIQDEGKVTAVQTHFAKARAFARDVCESTEATSFEFYVNKGFTSNYP